MHLLLKQRWMGSSKKLFVSLCQVSICKRDRVFSAEKPYCSTLPGINNHSATGRFKPSIYFSEQSSATQWSHTVSDRWRLMFY